MILTKDNQVKSFKPHKTKSKKKPSKVPTPTPDGIKECFGCGKGYNLSIHHVYNKSARNFSSKNKCVVWLCWKCHQSSKGIHGTHSDGKLNLILRQKFQLELESNGMSRKEFIFKVGRNYL